MRANAPWHAWRARTLAQRLRNRSLGVVFIKPHWGTLHSFNYANFSLRKSPEIPNVPPGPIPTDHGWNLIPMIGRVTADELRQGLAPDELLVLDTTRALELRPDCRYDNLHIRPEVLAGSVLRTLVAGAAKRLRAGGRLFIVTQTYVPVGTLLAQQAHRLTDVAAGFDDGRFTVWTATRAPRGKARGANAERPSGTGRSRKRGASADPVNDGRLGESRAQQKRACRKAPSA